MKPPPLVRQELGEIMREIMLQRGGGGFDPELMKPPPLVRQEPRGIMREIMLQRGGGGFDPELIIYN